MFKKIITFVVLLTVLFSFQSQSWAAVVSAETEQANPQVIQLEQKPYMDLLAAPDFQIAAATGFNGMKVEPWFWFLSIVVPGLGQFMMGDMWRGILFFLAPVVLAIAATVVSGILVAAAGNVLTNPTGFAAAAGTASLVGLIIMLAALGLHIWNIVDAYFMNQEKSKAATIEDKMKLTAELNKKIAEFIEFSQKTSIVTYNHGATTVNYQFATF